MHRNAIQILLTDDEKVNLDLFEEAFQKIRIRTTVSVTANAPDLNDKLHVLCPTSPYLVLLNLDLVREAGLKSICRIRDIMPSKHVCIGAYSFSEKDEDIESAFVQGNNISFPTPKNVDTLVDVLEHAIVMFWIYYSSDLNIHNFMLRIQ